MDSRRILEFVVDLFYGTKVNNDPRPRATIQSKRQHLDHEVADIAAYLLLLCNELDIDLESAVLNKIEHNKAKYPADQVRGNSKKYDEYHAKD